MVAVGCQSGTHEGAPTPGEVDDGTDTTYVAVNPERSLAAVIDRTHFAFRTKGAAFEATHATHTAHVAAGTLRMTPFHRANGQVTSGAPLAFETVGVVRGSDSYDIDLRTTRIDSATGRLELDRATTVETLRNFEHGVEQSWAFAMPPEGIGDLTVKVAVAGMPFTSETDGGLHFGTPGKLGFRYSHATWIDANGVATPLKAKWVNKQIEIDVPEDILENSAYPAVLDPTVQAEVSADMPVAGWSGASALRSSIASDGTNSLAVWLDARNGTGDIFGARLDASGAVLDATGIAINTESDAADNPAVAFAGGTYVVVWDNGTSVRGATVSTAGAVGASATIGAGVEPEIASTGTGALVAYRTGGDVNVATFSGAFGAPAAVAAGVAATTPAVGANPGGDYLVTWTEATNLRGRFVSSAGAPGAAAFDINASTGSQLDGAVAFNGTSFVVVWSNNQAGINLDGATVSPAGVVTPVATGPGTRISGAANNQFQPSVACAAGNCLATWTDRQSFTTNVNDVYGAILSGTLTGTPFAIASLTDEQRDPSVTAIGAGYRVAFEDTRHGGTSTILTVSVSGAGAVGTPGNATVGNNQEERPSTAGSPTQFLVSWADSRAVGHDIFGGRISAAGAALDATGVAISAAARTQYNPASTFDGTNFANVWEDNRNGNQDIFFARTDATGATLDSAGVAISTATGDQTLPAIAFGNGVSLVAWQDGRAGATFDLYAALVTPAGTVSVNDIAVCTNAGNQRAPSIAYDAANNIFLVTWHDNSSGTDRVYAARVTTAGSVLDNCGVLVTTNAVVQNSSSVAAGGGSFFVAWTSGPDNSGDVFGARITANAGALMVLDPAGIAIATGDGITQREPSVAFVAGSFTVVWQQSGDIQGLVVRLNGTFDGAVFGVSANPELEARPSIIAGAGANNALVSYERDITSANATRVATRRLSYATTPGGGTAIPCTTNGQCMTGFCVDNFCCDTACGNNDQTDCQACAVNKGGQVNGTCTTITLARNWRCRGYADTFCDLIEVCNGAATTCPPDLGRRQGLTCNVAGGGTGTCPPNDASGSPHVCQ